MPYTNSSSSAEMDQPPKRSELLFVVDPSRRAHPTKTQQPQHDRNLDKDEHKYRNLDKDEPKYRNLNKDETNDRNLDKDEPKDEPKLELTKSELLFEYTPKQKPEPKPKPKSELIFEYTPKSPKEEGYLAEYERYEKSGADSKLIFDLSEWKARRKIISGPAITLPIHINLLKSSKQRQQAPITKASMIDQHGIQKQEKKYSIHDMMRLKPQKPALNRMRPAPPVIPQTPEAILHEIQSILNKLTDSSAVSSDLMTHIVALTKALADPSAVVSIIYPKSISEKKSTAMYVQICHKLVEEVGGPFLNALVQVCTADFNNRMTKRKEPAPVIENDDQFADYTAEKSKEVGNLIIIGELFKRSLIGENLVKEFLDRLSADTAFLSVPKTERDPSASDEELQLKQEYAERSFECIINLLDALCGCDQKVVEPYIKMITDMKERKLISIRLDTLASKLLKRNWNEQGVVPLTSRRFGLPSSVSDTDRTNAARMASSAHTQESRPAAQTSWGAPYQPRPTTQTRPTLTSISESPYGGSVKPKSASTTELFQKKADIDVEKMAAQLVAMIEEGQPLEKVMEAAKSLKGNARLAVYWDMLSTACNRDKDVRKSIVEFVFMTQETFSAFVFVQYVMKKPKKDGEHAADLAAEMLSTAQLAGRTTEASLCDALKMLSNDMRTTAQEVLPLLLAKMKRSSPSAAQSMFSFLKLRLAWLKEDTLSAYLKEDAASDKEHVESLVKATMKLSIADPLAPAREVFGESCVGDVLRMAELAMSLLGLRKDSGPSVLETLRALVGKSNKWSDSLLDGAILMFNEQGGDVAETVRWLMSSNVVSNEDFIKWADVEAPKIDRRNAIASLLEIEDEARKDTEWAEDEDESDE